MVLAGRMMCSNPTAARRKPTKMDREDDYQDDANPKRRSGLAEHCKDPRSLVERAVLPVPCIDAERDPDEER